MIDEKNDILRRIVFLKGSARKSAEGPDASLLTKLRKSRIFIRVAGAQPLGAAHRQSRAEVLRSLMWLGEDEYTGSNESGSGAADDINIGWNVVERRGDTLSSAFFTMTTTFARLATEAAANRFTEVELFTRSSISSRVALGLPVGQATGHPR
jgi:hypothetical protein